MTPDRQRSLPKWREIAPGRAASEREESHSSSFPVSLEDIRQAARRISPYVKKTPMWTNVVEGRSVRLKLENAQLTGSFKARGATNKLLLLDEHQRAAGVVACSSGNHGLAVATIAERLGIPATICVPQDVDPVKLAEIRKTGAEVSTDGKNYDEAAIEADRLVSDKGLTLIHPFDDPDVIAGQGTLGLEILEQAPTASSVLIPLSGGGLAAGTAIAIKSLRPKLPVIGVAVRNAAVLYHCLLAGRWIDVTESPTIASALAGGIGSQNRYTLQMVAHLLDSAVMVDEEMVRSGVARLSLDFQLRAEGGGAVAPAALLTRDLLRDEEIGPHPVAILSGGNIDPTLLESVISEASPGLSRWSTPGTK